jgi:hypothetical protein
LGIGENLQENVGNDLVSGKNNSETMASLVIKDQNSNGRRHMMAFPVQTVNIGWHVGGKVTIVARDTFQNNFAEVPWRRQSKAAVDNDWREYRIWQWTAPDVPVRKRTGPMTKISFNPSQATDDVFHGEGSTLKTNMPSLTWRQQNPEDHSTTIATTCRSQKRNEH